MSDSSSSVERPDGPSHRSAKLLTAILVVTFLAALLAVSLPFLRVKWIRSDLEARGGEVFTAAAGPSWMNGLAEPLEPLGFVRIVSADLMQVSVTDHDVDTLASLNTLQAAAFFGPKVSEASLRRLAHSSSLQSLELINCPGWTDALRADVKRDRPLLRVSARGPAFLGIAGVPHARGCLVRFVQTGSPAEEAGLAPGDVIATLGEDAVRDFEHITQLLARHRPEETVKVEFLRSDERHDVDAKLRAGAAGDVAARLAPFPEAVQSHQTTWGWPGLTEGKAQRIRCVPGLRKASDPATPAWFLEGFLEGAIPPIAMSWRDPRSTSDGSWRN